MQNTPLVSVLIPAYNHERYVQETIRSIIAQSYSPIELIVLDDGSRDSTFHKIKELQVECEKRFARTLFQTQANAGTCVTLNRLIAEARGEFIYLIASDDISAPHAIEKELNFLIQHPDYVLAVGDNVLINSDSQRIGCNNLQESTTPELAQYKTFADFLQQNSPVDSFNSELFGSYATLCQWNYIPNGYLVRKSAIDKVGGFTPLAPLEDWYLMLQLAKLGKMKFLNEELFFYRWHDGNTAKKVDHMYEMTVKTASYEYNKIISEVGMEHWKAIYQENAYSYIKLLSINPRFSLRLARALGDVQLILQLRSRHYCIASIVKGGKLGTLLRSIKRFFLH